MDNSLLAQTAIEKGISTLVVLEGHAPTQHNNESVTIEGNIDAPSRFIEGRSSEFEDSKRHALVSQTDGVIKLVINEQSVTDRYVVKGKIEVGKKFKTLGINNDSVSYSPEELANKFKLLRSLFVSNLEHSSICETLRNIKAKINREIEEANDQKGNVTRNFSQTVQSNMPDSIKLNIPLIEGEDSVEIEVNVVLEAEGSSTIKCYLESIDAAELIEKLFEERVNQEVEKIKNWVTVICV